MLNDVKQSSSKFFNHLRPLGMALVTLVIGVWMVACASGPAVKTQQYARLNNIKEYEAEFANVWVASLKALSEYELTEKDRDDGLIVTDWVYTTSTEKYVDYTVNGFPRKKYLQIRVQYKVTVEPLLGRTRVRVLPQEEVEVLGPNGEFKKWATSDDFDSANASKILDKISLNLLSQ